MTEEVRGDRVLSTRPGALIHLTRISPLAVPAPHIAAPSARCSGSVPTGILHFQVTTQVTSPEPSEVRG